MASKVLGFASHFGEFYQFRFIGGFEEGVSN
jgi:hypothetical protein